LVKDRVERITERVIGNLGWRGLHSWWIEGGNIDRGIKIFLI